MTTTTNILVVQGLKVKSATINAKNDVKLVLEADKDDVTAGAGTVADVLVSLEYHTTAADSSPVTVNLQGTSFEFSVVKFDVKQDSLTITMKTPEDEARDEALNGQILSAVAQHTAGDTAVELVLAAS